MAPAQRCWKAECLVHHSIVPRGGLFRLSRISGSTCLIGYDNLLPWFELAWVKVIEEKNEELTKAGRPAISRYHASDCSNLKGEFRHWTIEEQIEFSQKLFSVFREHPLHIHSFDLSLQVLVQEIPEAASNPTGLAYVLLLRMLMDQIQCHHIKHLSK